MARSCQPESGGNGTWEYMEFVVDRLRLKDTRWGFNSRRGVVGDVARDEVAYHWGSGPDEGSRDTYAWDIMVSHCGSESEPLVAGRERPRHALGLSRTVLERFQQLRSVRL